MSDGCLGSCGGRKKIACLKTIVLVGTMIFLGFFPWLAMADVSPLVPDVASLFAQTARDSGEGVLAPKCDSEAAPGELADASVLSEDEMRLHDLLEDMLVGTPMERMIPELLERDRETMAFLVGIGRKESSWGEHAPSKDGSDCFNYWGMKGTGSRGTGMGYACFGTPEEAIRVVGDRIATLVHEKHLDTPERMIVWKCGSTCEGHDPAGVAKWISDVKSVYHRFL